MKRLLFASTLLLLVLGMSYSPSLAQSDDGDGDGVSNSDDACPGAKGTKANRGCPETAKPLEQTQTASIAEADLLKLQVAYVEEIGAHDAKYKKLLDQYSTKLSTKLQRENLEARKVEVTEIKRIATKVLADHGTKITASNKKFFTDRLDDAEYRLRLVNTQLEIVTLDEKDSNSALGDDFLDKVITDKKPSVKTATTTTSARKTAKELNPNNEGKELFDAIAAGANARVEALIKSGMNLNYVQPNDDSSLMKAIRERNTYIAIKLLEAGADPNLVANDYGGSSIQIAVQMSNVELVKLLINKYRVDLNTKGKTNGYTPLYSAASFNQTDEIAKILLAAGANPNVYNSEGESPLSMATIYGIGNAVKDLLYGVSNQEIKNKAIGRSETVAAETKKIDAARLDSSQPTDKPTQAVSAREEKAAEALKEYQTLKDSVDYNMKRHNEAVTKYNRAGKDAQIFYKGTFAQMHQTLRNVDKLITVYLAKYENHIPAATYRDLKNIQEKARGGPIYETAPK